MNHLNDGFHIVTVGGQELPKAQPLILLPVLVDRVDNFLDFFLWSILDTKTCLEFDLPVLNPVIARFRFGRFPLLNSFFKTTKRVQFK